MSVTDLADTFVFPVRDLLGFSTATASVLEEVTLRTSQATREVGKDQEPIELILFDQFLQPDQSVRRGKRLYPPDMIFTLGDSGGDFDRLLKGWLEVSKRVHATINLMNGLAFAPPRMGDTTAMLWAQAIETYHRDSISAGAANEEAKRRLERVLSACPKEDRQWLEFKLKHADEPSLRRRINDVARRARPIVKDLLLRSKGFGLRLSGARNAFAHYGAAVGFSGLELYRLAQTARWVLVANFLLDLGFSPSAAKALIERNGGYDHLTKKADEAL